MKREVSEIPPSLNKAPGMSDAAFESEQTISRLQSAIESIGATRRNAKSAAHYLYDTFCIARLAARAKHKTGKAGPAAVAKQLKQIAAGATTLSKRLKSADPNTFKAWRDASDEHEDATQEWLKLKSLLEATHEAAVKAAKAAEAVAKIWSRPGQIGRPSDDVAEVVTIIAAHTFEEHGNLATRSISRNDGKPQGHFHLFLTEVFEALGMKSSPDASNARLQITRRTVKGGQR